MTEPILDVHFDEFHNRLVPLIKTRDYVSAEALCESYVGIADRAGDAEAAGTFVGFLANVLAIAGRDAEALAAYERAERYVPADPRRTITTACFLRGTLAREGPWLGPRIA